MSAAVAKILILGWLLPFNQAAQTNAVETPHHWFERGKEYHRQGDLEEAARLYARALPGLREAGDDETLAAALNLLSAANTSLGRYRDAVEQADQSSRLRSRLGDRQGVSMSLSNMGLAHYYLGEYEAALDRYQQALDIDRQNQDVEGQVANLNNIGNVFFLQGNYSAAWDCYQRALGVIDGHQQQEWAVSERYRTLVNLAALLQKLGLYRRALDIHSQLRDSGQTLPVSEQAQTLVNLGVLYRRLGDPVKAEQTYRRAEELFNLERHLDGQILVLKNLGIVQALDLGDLAAATASFSRAQRLAESSSDRQELMQTRLYLAETLRRQGLDRQAQTLFSSTLSLAQQLGAPEESWKSLYGLGRILRSQGRPAQARAHWEEAVGEIESLRSRLQAPSLRSGFLAEKREVFDSLISLYLEQIDGDEAVPLDRIVTLMEQSRRQSFRELFAPQPTASGANADLLRQLRELKAEITRVWRLQLSDEPDVDALRSRLAQLENEYQKIERQLGGGAETPFSEALSIAEIQARLGERTALTVLWVGQERLANVLLSRTQTRLFQKPLSQADRSAVASCAAQLARLGGQWRDACGPVAPILGREWIETLRSGAFRRIVVVPDRPFNALPVEILFGPETDELLIEGVSVSYVPDLEFLGRSRQPRRWRPPWAKSLAAFGNPQKSEQEGQFLEDVAGDLAFSGQEVESAARLLPGRADVFVGPAATRRAFAQSARAGYPILHLASHAEVDPSIPERTRIALSAPTRGAPNDYLFLGEIPNLPLGQVDLVVLSACETAAGAVDGAGGAESFGRAFLYAGANSTLATLWKIDDQSSAAFMKLFYHFAAQGLDKSEALRLAKLRFLESGGPLAHPYYWAGFVLYGQGDGPLPLPWSWTSIATGVLLLIAVGAGVLAWRAK